jgi:hypothetical protein
MTTTAKTMDPPVNLPLPEPWPDPMPGCKVCAALASERSEAQAKDDRSKVSDCNVEIRAHQSPHLRRRP